jgi:glycosyltransferase involved in cell wall biosynthesis
MQVLIVSPGIYVYGGAELVIVKLANYLTKKGIKNSLLTTSILPEVEKELVETEIIIQERPKTILNNLKINEAKALYKGVHKVVDKFDVINIHNYPAELSVFGIKKPVVWMCNEPELYLTISHLRLPFHWKLIGKTLFIFERFIVNHYIKKVVVADRFNARRFEKIYGFKPEIVNYGIDYEFFSKKGNEKEILEKFNLSKNFTVLQVGMLNFFKNQLESVKVIERLRTKIPGIKLILAGWGDENYQRIVEGYIKKKNLDQDVIITGSLDRKEIRTLYHFCDVLVHPVKFQGGWLAPFEALCAKKPIIVSPEMSTAEIIKREGIGVVTNDFVNAIFEVYNNREKFAKVAEKGQKWVKRNLSWDNFCKKMTRILYEYGTKQN